MNMTSGRHCWEITRCEAKEYCLAYKRPDVACWDLVNELNDYRRIYKVCEDCIVYISKQENSFLSVQEIEAIMAHKGICPLDPKAIERHT